MLLGLAYLTPCLQHNATLPIRLPSTAFSKGSTCPLPNTIGAQRELVRKTLQSYYPPSSSPCSCGREDWTRAVYLNMSDPNQQCPSNWTLVTTPIRGCGRRNINYSSCDSATFSVHGHTYSSVCGRILAYQRGWTIAFYSALQLIADTIDEAYLSGVSLTHGPAGSRQHIWSFVGALYEQDPNYETVPVRTSMFPGLTKFLHLLIMTISVILGTLDLAITLNTTLMTHCGMVRVATAQAPAVSSTLRLGFAHLYPSLQMMTWR